MGVIIFQRSKRHLKSVICPVFVLLVPTCAQFLFSWMGFNPTDDGFILAGSRRMMEGQIPHLDFISIRPVGSYLLHVPFVLFGGDYTFWLSRYFVWFQFACIAWFWTVIIDKLLENRFTSTQRVLYALVAFTLSSHNFPIMAWHSIDSLFLFSIGLALVLRSSQYAKVLGYALIGLAPLSRQNFLLMIPASIILVGDWRQIRFWLSAAMPALFAGVYLWIVGAASDAILQIGSRAGGILSVGMKSYISHWTMPWGILLGYWAMYLSFGQVKMRALAKRTGTQRLLGILVLYGVLLGIAVALSQGIWIRRVADLGLLPSRVAETLSQVNYIWAPCFGLFGAVAGATMYFVVEDQGQSGYVRVGLVLLLTAWSVSLSIGYNTPALAAGPLAVLLMAYGHISSRSSSGRNSWTEKLSVSLMVVVVIVTIFSYGMARQEHIYRERPARELTQALDRVFSGGNLIRTNPNTFAFLADLRIAIGRTKDQDYAILPDLAGYWARSTQTNPLPIDWVQGTELSHPALVNRVLRVLEARRSSMVLIVQKVRADSLANGFIPLSDSDYYAIVRYVRSHFTKIGETEYFDLYE